MKRYTLSDCPVRVEIPVAWGDMDAFGHVNNTKYFVYFETVRISYFEAVMPFNDGIPEGIGPILSKTSCQFRAPVKYPDTLDVGAKVVALEEDRFEMVFVAESRALNCVAALGNCTVVSFDYEKQQKAPLPDAWLSTIKKLESWDS